MFLDVELSYNFYRNSITICSCSYSTLLCYFSRSINRPDLAVIFLRQFHWSYKADADCTETYRHSDSKLRSLRQCDGRWILLSWRDADPAHDKQQRHDSGARISLCIVNITIVTIERKYLCTTS